MDPLVPRTGRRHLRGRENRSFGTGKNNYRIVEYFVSRLRACKFTTMGLHKTSRCFITGLETTDMGPDFDGYYYRIKIGSGFRFFKFGIDYKNDEFIERNKHVLIQLLEEDRFPEAYCREDPEKLEYLILLRIIQDNTSDDMKRP